MKENRCPYCGLDKEEKSHSDKRMADELSKICKQKADEGEQAANHSNQVTGNRKKFFYFFKKRPIWAYYAGIWTAILLHELLDLLSSIGSIG